MDFGRHTDGYVQQRAPSAFEPDNVSYTFLYSLLQLYYGTGVDLWICACVRPMSVPTLRIIRVRVSVDVVLHRRGHSTTVTSRLGLNRGIEIRGGQGRA